jgi:Asp-tRNA(Asn)/Glu-tRNA(Gln) amidotransferase A subunit family amidase
MMTSGTAFANLKGAKSASADDPIVARFRKLGAIIIGTTVMTEFGVTPLGWSSVFQGPVSWFPTAPQSTTYHFQSRP